MPVPHDQLPRMEPISTRVNVYTTTKPAHRERPSSPLWKTPGPTPHVNCPRDKSLGDPSASAQ